jgi:phosphatidylserine/phosphatidylglycerophosphate/cardiolipin synthase-like enzyme
VGERGRESVIEAPFIEAIVTQPQHKPPNAGREARRQAFAPVEEAIRKHGQEVRQPDGVVSVRPGYRFQDEWITDDPAIVVTVLPEQQAAVTQSLPRSYDGVPVDVTPATPDEQIQALQALEAGARAAAAALPEEELALPGWDSGAAPPEEEFRAPTRAYEPPPRADLREVRGAMTLTCHASPDAGWRTLKPFLDGTNERLTVAMYDFTAPHILEAVRADLEKGNRQLRLILDPGLALGNGGEANNPKKNDVTEDEVKEELSAALGDRLSFEWAAVKHTGKTTGGIFPSAYHIKVAVRDGKAFWLSSGNWQSSNQGNFDSFPPRAERGRVLGVYNREWHILVEHPGVAGLYEQFIDWDMKQAAPLQDLLGARAAAVGLPDLLVSEEPEERAAVQFFDSQSFHFTAENPVRVQPLLTPDNYAEHVLPLLEGAKKSIYFQNQYISITRKTAPLFDQLVDALLAQIEAGREVFIILRDIGDSRKMLEALRYRGFPPSCIKLQKACHNKGIILDSEVVVLGSHNWSSPGTTANRDASLIIHDPGVAGYYQKIFLYDWNHQARQKASAVERMPVVHRPRAGARAAEEIPAGVVRVPWGAYHDGWQPLGSEAAARVAQPGPRLHALLIGIDYYRPGNIDGLTYPCLRGCVRDISHVEDFLRRRLGLSDDRLVKLTSSNPSAAAAGPVEPPDSQPTYANMVAAFRKVARAARPGDQVYIHYSGHGGRTPTIWPKLKPDGLDESLVPLDIHDPKAQYLRDLELAHLLQEMVDRGLYVTLVLDSCHSGGATRGLGPAVSEDVAVRGVDREDRTVRPTESLVAPADVLAQTWQRQSERATRNLTSDSGWMPASNDYVLLAACRPHEFAYEKAFDGQERNGALTYWLLDALRGLSPGLSYQPLYDRILAKVHTQFERQTPVALGPMGRAFLRTDRVPVQQAALVLQVEMEKKRVLIAAGQAFGLRPGAQFALYPQGADLNSAADRAALATVTEVKAAESWAELVEGSVKGDLQSGDRAVLLGSVRLKRKVRLAANLKAVQDALKNSGWVEEAGAEGGADFHVALDENGRAYVIGDAAGKPLTHMGAPLLPGKEADLVKRLEHLAKYRAVEEIENHNEDSPLHDKLVVTLLGRQRDYDPVDKPAPTPFADAGAPQLEVGEWTFVRIRNSSNRVLNVAALDLQPDWGISPVFPRSQDLSFEALEPGKERILKLKASLPEGYDEGTDVLKVFGTVGIADFRLLTLPALGVGQMRGVRKAAAPQSALDALLDAVVPEKPTTRTLTPGAAASEEWAVVQLQFGVLRKP